MDKKFLTVASFFWFFHLAVSWQVKSPTTPPCVQSTTLWCTPWFPSNTYSPYFYTCFKMVCTSSTDLHINYEVCTRCVEEHNDTADQLVEWKYFLTLVLKEHKMVYSTRRKASISLDAACYGVEFCKSAAAKFGETEPCASSWPAICKPVTGKGPLSRYYWTLVSIIPSQYRQWCGKLSAGAQQHFADIFPLTNLLPSRIVENTVLFNLIIYFKSTSDKNVLSFKKNSYFHDGNAIWF